MVLGKGKELNGKDEEGLNGNLRIFQQTVSI